MADVRETMEIDAPASRVYELVSDLPRMGEWSPECERVSWRGKVRSPVKGAHFVGYNRRGTVRWVTFGTVVAAEPGRHFAFEVYVGPAQALAVGVLHRPARGRSRLTWPNSGPTAGRRWTLVLERFFGNRNTVNRHGIHLTLAALKRAAESSAYA